MTDWPFEQPPNCAVITVWRIADGLDPILHVTHDADDGGWQFLGLKSPSVNDASVVSLASVLARDPTIREVANLPRGWHAWRREVNEPWTRGPNPSWPTTG